MYASRVFFNRCHHEQQYSEMQNTFETELSNIDKAYVEERKTTLFANKKGALALV